MSYLARGSHIRLAVIRAEVEGEAQAFLPGIPYPVLFIAHVCQIPAAYPLLKLPKVTPKLEILRGRRKKMELMFLKFMATKIWYQSTNVSHPQPRVSECFAHTEPPSD